MDIFIFSYFWILVEVVLLELQGFFVLDDLLHKLHGRIVFTRILLFLGLDDDFGKHYIGRRQRHVEHFRTGGELHFLGDVADGGECQFIPPFTRLHLVFSVGIGDASYAFSFVLHGDVHQRFVGE